jgi:Tol biopolymer transport system component
VGAGTTGPTITPQAGQHRHGTWSPDRTMIAYARGTPGSPTTENFDIYILDVTTPGATPQPITNEGDSLSADRPAWSPDGTRIAYEHQPTDNSAERDIRVHTVQGGGTLDLTTGAPIETKPAWSPDSQTIYYARGDVNTAPAPMVSANIVREPADNGGSPTLAVADSGVHEFQPSISPDGTKICFTLGNAFDSSASVLTANLTTPPDPGPVVLATGGGGNYNCTWSPDGTKIAYVNGTFTTGALVMENSDNSGGFVVLEDDSMNFDGNPDWAPDGRPECQNATATTDFNTPVTIPLSCADTGPQYERTSLIVDVPNDANPTNGTVGEVQQGDPATVTYTPNANFTGTDHSRSGSGTRSRSADAPP